ncbi:MAG TPA: hypothetical protein PKA99_15070, partial [Dermatophilaceae bacterium]|nr:hypothetical protein [Dermatophilaceae bacterium]
AWRLHQVSDPTPEQLRELLEEDFRGEDSAPELVEIERPEPQPETVTPPGTSQPTESSEPSDATEQGDQA